MTFVPEHDNALLECNVSVNTNSHSSSVKGYQPHFKIIPHFLKSPTLPTSRSSQLLLINRNVTVKLSSINTIHVKQQHNVGFFIFKFTLKYMLGNVYISDMQVGRKQLGRKDFSMEQLPIDSYMLLGKQKNSVSVNK